MRRTRLYGDEDFTWRLRSRLPMNVWFSFSGEQLEALRHAFGARFQRRHSVDMRGRLHLPWSRYYVVFQLGRDKRADPSRGRAGRVRTIAHSTMLVLLVLVGLVGLTWLAMHIP